VNCRSPPAWAEAVLVSSMPNRTRSASGSARSRARSPVSCEAAAPPAAGARGHVTGNRSIYLPTSEDEAVRSPRFASTGLE